MLKMSKNPRNITIFEGPDGSGKTTIAKEYAKRTGALYVHFEAYYGVKDIYKFFIEAAQPALLGYQDVVFDRCWHSGPIYDVVFRNLQPHEQRQTPEICLLLDRAVAHCSAVLVKCYPDQDTCINNWKSRLDTELVKSEFKMRAIHGLYEHLENTITLPSMEWNYTLKDSTIDKLIHDVEYAYERRAYDYSDAVHIVVSSGSKTNADVMIDIPGVRFEPTTNEYKLAQVLGFREDDDVCNVVGEELVKFLPVDTDFFEYFNMANHSSHTQRVIAIGDEAIAAVERFSVALNTVPHPGIVKDIRFTRLLDVEADQYMRDIESLPQLAEFIRIAYNEVATGDAVDEVPADEEGAPSRPESVREMDVRTGCNIKEKADQGEKTSTGQCCQGAGVGERIPGTQQILDIRVTKCDDETRVVVYADGDKISSSDLNTTRNTLAEVLP